MTGNADTQLLLQPIVSWPRAMTAGRRHLVTVDLRLADPAAAWPYREQELAFTCMLDGHDWCSVEAVHDASVLVHRTGGSEGPAEFVVTPRQASAARSGSRSSRRAGCPSVPPNCLYRSLPRRPNPPRAHLTALATFSPRWNSRHRG